MMRIATYSQLAEVIDEDSWCWTSKRAVEDTLEFAQKSYRILKARQYAQQVGDLCALQNAELDLEQLLRDVDCP